MTYRALAAWSLTCLWLGVAAAHAASPDISAHATADAAGDADNAPAGAVVQLDAAAQRLGGIATAILPATMTAATRIVPASLVDAAPLLALRTRLQVAQARQTLAAATLARMRHLYQAGRNISAARLEQAESADQIAQATASGLRAQVRARWGAALGQAVIAGTAPLPALAAGRAGLVAVAVAGAAPHPAPTNLQATTPGGAALRLTLIGAAGQVPTGFAGVMLYYLAPHRAASGGAAPDGATPDGATPDGATPDGATSGGLAAGTPLAVALAEGPARRGVVVPASAVLYLGDESYAYRQTAPTSFARIIIPTDIPIRHDGRLVGYFTTQIAPGARLVVRGAAVLFSASQAARGAGGGGRDDD